MVFLSPLSSLEALRAPAAARGMSRWVLPHFLPRIAPLGLQEAGPGPRESQSFLQPESPTQQRRCRQASLHIPQQVEQPSTIMSLLNDPVSLAFPVATAVPCVHLPLPYLFQVRTESSVRAYSGA